MSQTKKGLLPLGSIVYLEEGNQKLHIIGRGITFDDPDTGEQVFTDYMAEKATLFCTKSIKCFC